jgi:hypothetical protein
MARIAPLAPSRWRPILRSRAHCETRFILARSKISPVLQADGEVVGRRAGGEPHGGPLAERGVFRVRGRGCSLAVS